MDDETSKVLLRGVQEVGALLVKIGETMLNCAREAHGPSTSAAVAAPKPAAATLPAVQTQSHANPPASSAPSKPASSRGRPAKRSSASGAAIPKASTTAQGQTSVASAAPGTKPSAKSSVARPSRSAQASGSLGRGRGATAKRVPASTSLPAESSAAAKARSAAAATTTTTSTGKRASLTKGKSPARSELPRKDARQPQRHEDDDDDDESSDSSEGPAVETKRRAQPARSFEDGSDDDDDDEEDDDTSAAGSDERQGKPAERTDQQEDLYEDVELENDSSDSDSTDDDLLDDAPVKRLLTKDARTSAPASAITTKVPAARGRKRKVAEPSPRQEQAVIDEDILDGGTASVANAQGNPNGKSAVPRQSSSSKRQGSLAAKDGTAPPTTKRKRVTWTPEKDALIIRVVRENPNGSEALVMREMADVFGEQISQYQTKARFRNLIANGILKKRKPRGFVVAGDDDNQSQDNDSEKSTPELSHIPAIESPPRKPSVSAARIQKEPAKTSGRIRSATRAQ